MAGRTTLIIAHRLSTIGLADRVAVIDRGHVVALGTHAELLATEPRYAEILAQGAPPAEVRPLGVDEGVVAHAIEVDVERSRTLDADVGEMRDLD
jgi:ABC-type multidrug transport system ATPase subunit